jgi:hypothetical protein
MKVLNLQADNFKNLKAVEIDPDTNMVVVGGKNEQGKSSVMDAVWVALKGRAAAPPKPIRNGEEECRLRLDLGELIVTRKFTAKEGGTYTDSVKVENAAGLRYGKPQEVLDALLGEIGFDPFEFARMKPKDQADSLLQMVPLSVDLDELAQADTSDFAKRRDVNRDAHQVKAQMDAIPKEDVPADAPDRQALEDQLGEAANINTEISRERDRRESEARDINRVIGLADEAEAEAKDLRERADRLDAAAKEKRADADKRTEALGALPALKEPVDTEAVRRLLAEAQSTLAAIERQRNRSNLEQRYAALFAESEAFTKAMADRATARTEALRKAKMPIEGLEFVVDDAGKATVNLNGVPFEQASTAAKLRASTAIAMAANPELRILRISDGSLLDDDSMAMLRSMAEADDFQLWVEVVGEGDRVGIVMENGEVRADKPAAKKAAPAKKAEALL